MFFYGVLTVMAIFAATLAPRDERIPAYWCGTILMASWALWGISMRTEWGPAFLLSRIGVWIDPVDIWSFTDFAAMIAIPLIGRVRWWTITLCSILAVQIALHCVYMLGAIEFRPYGSALDFLFLGQLAVLFAIGGPGAVDRLLDWSAVRASNAGEDRAAEAVKKEEAS